MFSLYRTPWIDRRSLKLLGYTLSAGPNEIRTDVENHYKAMKDGKMTDALRNLNKQAVPVHSQCGFITEEICIPEDSVFGEYLRKVVDAQGALQSDDVFIIHPLCGEAEWCEIHALPAVGERLVIAYKKPEFVKAKYFAEVKNLTERPCIVKNERRKFTTSPAAPTSPRGRRKHSPAPTRLTHE